jgi:hypothetical protein
MPVSPDRIELAPGIESDKIFNFAHELHKTFEVLRRNVSSQVVLQWLQKQVEFVLTEFGVGESLAIQPPTWQLVRLGPEGNLEVLSQTAQDYGNQLPSFLKAEGFPSPVREGLWRAYRGLAQAGAGEGYVRYSPTDFYRHLGSRYDVLEFYRVVETGSDGFRLVETRYVLLNILPDYARATVVNWHGERPSLPADVSPEQLISSPQKFRFSDLALRAQDPIAAHAAWLEQRFQQQLGRPMMAGDDDRSLYAMVETLVKDHVDQLRQLLLAEDNRAFIRKLKDLILKSQSGWAETKGLDPVRHLEDILAGRIVMGGVEGTLSFDADKDVFQVIRELFGWGTEGVKRQCRIHGEYAGNHCPQCA